MITRYTYSYDPEGKLVRTKESAKRTREYLEDLDTRMVKTLHHLECREGSRFRLPKLPISTYQKVWPKL